MEKVHDSYEEVIADPDVEAVYNPLANSLHATWNIKALQAGKHVFTEKPSASNADEAAYVEKIAAPSDVVFFEGFHYYWHPLIARLYAFWPAARSANYSTSKPSWTCRRRRRPIRAGRSTWPAAR